MRARAWWNNEVVAESDDVVLADGRHYFPERDVRTEFLQESQTATTHPQTGEVRYFHVVVEGELNADAAWTIPRPEPGWERLEGRVAFWHGIEVEAL
ncbi:MAG: DUF427 domain-containing protein [Gemmatimonadetes bacterium]|nr:DUF427 domain-containing protein [Gemmatimonadota bacterium]